MHRRDARRSGHAVGCGRRRPGQSIEKGDLKEWLSYIASDELEGRGVVLDRPRPGCRLHREPPAPWGAKPAGDNGVSYLQTVRVLGVKATGHSTVTLRSVARRERSRTGQGITFPRNVGGKRRLTIDRVEFAGYGVDAPRANHVDFAGKDVQGAAVVWLGTRGPRELERLDRPAGCSRAAIVTRPSTCTRRP